MSLGVARAMVGIGLLFSLGVGAGSASADGQLPSGTVKVEVLDGAGNPDTQAGSHPARMITSTRTLFALDGSPEFNKVLVVDFPTGMGGDPNSSLLCSREVFDGFPEAECPSASQIGVQMAVTGSGTESIPIYNLEPAPGEVASFGTMNAFFRSKFSAHLRTTDYGLETRIEGLPQLSPGELATESKLEFWGIPADHQIGNSAARVPFLTNPTRCGEPIAVHVRVLTWEHPDEWRGGSGDTGLPLTGCDKLAFAPRVKIAMDHPVADTPTGISLESIFPNSVDVDQLASSQARSTHIQFPEGMAFSAGAASRLTVCTDAQLAAASDSPASCPRASKIGSIEIGLASLDKPLVGHLYIGEEHPHERFRLFAVASGAGTETKFVSAMRPDPVTGALAATLDDLPQIPFEYLLMHLDGGPKGLMMAPRTCGPATAHATFVPYSGGPPVRAEDTVAIGPQPGHRCGEPVPFEPTLETAISTHRAGKPTSFTMILGRRDGEQLTDRFSFELPQGLSANMGSTARCSDAQVAAASCPVASRVGSAFAQIGSGSSTAELTGSSYMTGPYRQGPFGFALIFSGKLGPFDLGAFTVRTAMKLDPLTGRVTVQGDSIPQTFEGVPIRFQQIGLTMDREGFMRNPTSCDPMHVAATIYSTEGALARPEDELSVGGCVALPFEPKLGLALTGDRAQLRSGGRPGLRLSTKTRQGDANMRSLAMSLPAGLRMSGAGLTALCPRRRAVSGKCPKGAKVGVGFGRTSLLAKPMHGTVYLAQPEDSKGEPELWTHLEGEGVELNLHSSSEVEHGHVVNRFDDMPDMSLSAFTMRLTGGKHGVLVLDRGICRSGKSRRLLAPVKIEAQNGARRSERLRVGVPDGCRAG